MKSRPLIGIVTGDPNGIGAEIVAGAWASKALHPRCRPVVIGSADIVAEAIRITGHALTVRSLAGEAGLAAGGGDDTVIEVLESAPFAADAIRYGEDRTDAGAASGAWLDHADRLARAGRLDGTVMGPISARAMEMAGKLSSIAGLRPGEEAFLLLRSGPLVIAHLTDHVPLRKVASMIRPEAVLRLITLLAQSMQRWGLGGRHIGVAGFNPHASGDEERHGIAPAVEMARIAGIDVEGPISPDSIFRHCIEGRYGAVIAMYHDQGHIAIKTWGFSGNNVVFLGQPYVHTTVAHGVAYELAGSGRADSSMIRNAILNAASLAAGRGFHDE